MFLVDHPFIRLQCCAHIPNQTIPSTISDEEVSMKKPALLLLAVLVGLCVVTAPSFAQFKMKIGPATGFNFNIHSGSDLQESGNGIGLMIGGEADMSFSPTIGLLARLVFYDNMSGGYSQSGTDQYYGNWSQDVSASVGYFTIDALFKFNLPKSKFFFVGGPSFGINEESSYEVTTKIQGYQDQKAKGSLKDTKARFALKLGSGYDIPIAHKIEISPFATFSLGLTDVVSDVKWKIISIHAGASVKFEVL